MRLSQVLIPTVLTGMLFALTGVADAAGVLVQDDLTTVAEPDPQQAQRLFASSVPVRLERLEGAVPRWSVSAPDGLLGYIASTWEIARSVGYSGRPIDVLVAVTGDNRIAGAELMRHNEPILTLGISTADIERYVGGFAGVDLTQQQSSDLEARSDLPDIISRATVTTGVIRDAILRTARTVALAHGSAGGDAGRRIDRVQFQEMSWPALSDIGALVRTTTTLDQAREALTGAKTLPPAGDAEFLDLWIAMLDPPTIGQSLLGQQTYTRAMAGLAAGEAALFVASRGLHSHRGTKWRRSGVFDRISVVQDGETFPLQAEGYRRIDRLAAAEAPEFKEVSVFALPAVDFDPTRPFRVEVTASRPAETGEVSFTIPLDYVLPDRFIIAPQPLPEAEPLWVAAWKRKRVEIVGVAAMLSALAAILFFQEAFVRRAALWRWGRTAFLTVTLVWLGWIAGGQLSVIHVIAFLQSLLTGFRWETFLMEPTVFMLWSFVALGVLFWGRGVYCGWLCPFGALQELSNELAQRLKVPQVRVPYVVQERLWVVKYTLFVALLGLSFYSMRQALVLAEVEPFKTAMSMHFMRAWPFVTFAVALLVAGLFIERFYCRYLCPLGAALSIPAKLRLFDWLRRRPQCGRECRLCDKKCTVGAIDPIGRINPNECILCLRCQMIYHDVKTCVVLKGRAARTAGARRPGGVAT